MNINIQLEHALNLSDENDVMNFGAKNSPAVDGLAGASWIATGFSPDETLRNILQVIFRSVRENIAESSIWLLIGHTVWQSDTRIVRHHKLWGALSARCINIPLGERSQEVELESEGGLKYVGAVRLSEFSVDRTVEILLKERGAYLALLPDDLEIEQVIRQGWSGRIVEDISLLTHVGQSGGLLFKKVGEFDDQEWGMMAVGEPSALNYLIK